MRTPDELHELLWKMDANDPKTFNNWIENIQSEAYNQALNDLMNILKKNDTINANQFSIKTII